MANPFFFSIAATCFLHCLSYICLKSEAMNKFKLSYTSGSLRLEREFSSIKSLNQYALRNSVHMVIRGRFAYYCGAWHPFTCIGSTVVTLPELLLKVQELQKYKGRFEF